MSNSIPVVSSLVDWGWNVAKRIMTQNEEQSLSRESSFSPMLLESESTRLGPRNTSDDPIPLPRPDHNDEVYDSPASNDSSYSNWITSERRTRQKNSSFELENFQLSDFEKSGTQKRRSFDLNSGQKFEHVTTEMKSQSEDASDHIFIS